MTLSKIWVYGIAIVLAALAALGGYELVQEHDARLKAEATAAAQQTAIATAQKSADQAKADQVQTASDLKVQLEAIAAQRIVVVTPQQAAAVANKLPDLPTPVTVEETGTRVQGPGTANTPQQQLVIPAVDIPALQKYKLDCDAANASLAACVKNLADEHTQLAAAQNQFKAEEITAASWEATAKGGTWWHRMKTAAKYIAIGGAVGYVAGHKF